VKKYRISSISGNSKYAGECGVSGDPCANVILKHAGFVDSQGRNDTPHLFIGCVPAKGKNIFVYYDEPASDSEKGSFRLVDLWVNGTEYEIDRGTAGKSHGDVGIRTFYGRGSEHMVSWSFHCDPDPVV
jgi:hypothetical protein